MAIIHVKVQIIICLIHGNTLYIVIIHTTTGIYHEHILKRYIYVMQNMRTFDSPHTFQTHPAMYIEQKTLTFRLSMLFFQDTATNRECI